jgi:ribose transport system permease protein
MADERTLRLRMSRLAEDLRKDWTELRFVLSRLRRNSVEITATFAALLALRQTRKPGVAADPGESNPNAFLPRVATALRLPQTLDFAELPLAFKAFAATAVLVVIGGIAAPSTINSAAILSTLPYFAILAVASIGQHLVIQQRGLDLSTAGIMSFCAVVVTKLPNASTNAGVVLFFILVSLAVGTAIGAFTGLVVTLLEVPPLVTTIGVNAILFGLTYFVSTGASVQSPMMMVNFFEGRFLAVPTTVWVLLLVAGATVFVLALTATGRRFIAVSVNPRAAHAVGIPLKAFSIATYALAGFMYALAAIMLSGYLVSPTVLCGLTYLLGTIAAVVVGGNSLGGLSKGSVVATVIGAFFLTYLAQLVTALGFRGSAEDLADALIVLGGVALPEITRRLRYA